MAITPKTREIPPSMRPSHAVVPRPSPVPGARTALGLALLLAALPSAAAPALQPVVLVPADDTARAVVDIVAGQLIGAGVAVKTASNRAPTVACLAGKDAALQRTCLLEAAGQGLARGLVLVRATAGQGLLDAHLEVLGLASRAIVFQDVVKAPPRVFSRASAPMVKHLVAALAQLGPVDVPAPPPTPLAPPAERSADAPTIAATVPASRRLALLGVVAGQGVPPAAAAALEQGLDDALRKLPGLTLVSAAEVRDLLGLERARTLVEDSRLDPTRVGLLDADELVVGRITLVGASLSLDVRRVDARTGDALGTRTAAVPRDDEAQLLHAAPGLVAALFPEVRPAAPSPAPTVAADSRPLRVAVLEVRAVGDVPPRALAALDQSVTPELRKLQGLSAVNAAEVRDMLSLERQKELLGCAGDAASCFAEIAGALDADEMITLDLTLVGSTYALASRRIDLRKSRVVQTRLERFERRDGEELLAVVGPLMAALYPERPLKPGRPRGVEAAVIRRLNPPPLPRWAFFTTAGLGVAAGLAAGTSGLLLVDAQRQYNAAGARAVQEPVTAADLAARAAVAQGWATRTTAFLAAAASLAVIAGLEAFFTDWRDDRAAFTVQPVALLGGGDLGFAVTFSATSR